MRSIRSKKFRRYWRMSSLRQAVIMAFILLVLHLVGAIFAIDLVESRIEERQNEVLQKRFDIIALEIENRGFDNFDYTQAIGHIVYFAGNQNSARSAPEGIFELRGIVDEDQLSEHELDGPQSWYYFVGETAGSVLAVGSNQWVGPIFIHIVSNTFLVVVSSVYLVVIALGFLFSIRQQRRLNRMASVLDQAASGEFSARIKPDRVRDDLDNLALKIDHSIDRLETLFIQSRNLSANLAHDLKTPIARLRIRLETALLHDSGGPVSDQLEGAIQQVDSIITIFEALLSIARLEARNTRKSYVPVNLAELVEDVASAFGPVIEDKGFKFGVRCTNSATVEGNPVLLKQMLVNLIENALLHTPAGSEIRLIVDENRLVVADTGPGIAHEDIAKVVKPSVRLDNSRSKPGAGLGLAMVKAIAEAHGCELVLSGPPDGESQGLWVSCIF